MVLNGRRHPSEALLDSMTAPGGLLADLNGAERDYVKLLARLERAKGKGQDPTPYLDRIQKLGRGHIRPNVYGLTNHSLLRDWFVLVIRELIPMKGFKERGAWIREKLGRRVTVAQAAHAIDVLLAVGAIARDEETGKLVPKAGFGESTQDVPSEAIRAHHRGMLEQAALALDRDPVERRQFNALTFKMDPSRMADFKKRMVAFVRELHTEFEDSESGHVFQFNMHLFEHTAAPQPKPSTPTRIQS